MDNQQLINAGAKEFFGIYTMEMEMIRMPSKLVDIKDAQ